jgi:hypothetical protein
MANSYGEILTARGGSYILNDTEVYKDKLFYSIIVLEDTQFDQLSTISVNEIVDEVLNQHIQNPNGIIKAGATITPMDINKPFFSIRLVSGSVQLVLK